MRALPLLLVAAASTPALAGTYELGIGPTTRALRSSSADAVTSDSLDGGALTAAHRLDLPVAPGLATWVEAGLGWGGATGTMFQTLATELGSQTWTVGGRARYPVVRNIWASARLDVGMARGSLSLADTAGHSASDAGWAPVAMGAVALDLLAIDRPRFAFGMRFELGYVAAASVSLTAHPDRANDGTLQLAMTSASLGHLDLSGPSFDLAFVSQF